MKVWVVLGSIGYPIIGMIGVGSQYIENTEGEAGGLLPTLLARICAGIRGESRTAQECQRRYTRYASGANKQGAGNRKSGRRR